MQLSEVPVSLILLVTKRINELHLHDVTLSSQLIRQPCCFQGTLIRSSKLRTLCCWPCCTRRCTRPLPKALAAILQTTNLELCCLRDHQAQAKPPAQGLCPSHSPSPTLQGCSTSIPFLLCSFRSCFALQALRGLHTDLLSVCGLLVGFGEGILCWVNDHVVQLC